MKLRIESDGISTTTAVRVLREGTADLLDDVTSIVWSCSLTPDHQADWCKAVITLEGTPAELIGYAPDELLEPVPPRPST